MMDTEADKPCSKDDDESHIWSFATITVHRDSEYIDELIINDYVIPLIFEKSNTLGNSARWDECYMQSSLLKSHLFQL